MTLSGVHVFQGNGTEYEYAAPRRGRRAALRRLQWLLPYLVIWTVAGIYLWAMLDGSPSCNGACVVVHVYFAYVAIGMGVFLSVITGIAQLALLTLRRRGRRTSSP